MNDRQLIKNLKLLNRLTPSSQTMAELKKEIFMHVKTKESKDSSDNVFGFLFAQNIRSWRPMIVSGAFALVAILFIGFMFGGSVLNYKLQAKATQVQIAMAPNKLEKSKISLEFSNRQLEDQKMADVTSIVSTRAIADSTLQTNAQLASLSLMGEPGKYTGTECQNLYREYDKYLISLKKTVEDKIAKSADESSLAELHNLDRQIAQYETQTDARLKQYTKP